MMQPLAADSPELAPVDADAFSPSVGLVERVTRWATQAAVIFLVVMMGIEMVARSALGWSLQVTNELGGYALIAITFLGLASGQADHAFHRVHMLDKRLSPVGRAGLRLVFDLATLAVSAVLCAEFTRFLWITWQSGDVAATSLVTPLWMPRLAMPVGMLALVITLLRTVAGDLRRLRAARRHAAVPSLQRVAL